MNNELRIKCNYLINNFGTSQTFISSKCGVTRAYINMWLLNKRELSDDVLIRMNNWINSLKLKN